MAQSCFASRLGDLITWAPDEIAALATLEERTRSLRRGTVLVRENDLRGELFILLKGMMMSYVLLDDGSRQIMRFYSPGEMLGVSSMVFRRAVETLAAVTDSVVAVFERQALTAIVAEHPRLAAVVMVANQMERVTLTDRLAALGRTSAKARVAALLLELRNSLALTDRSITDSFPLALTQEEIGDATGLTAVHVNRMLRRLEEEGLIRRENGRVILRQEAQLARIANYANRFDALDLGWLSAAG